MSNALKRKIFTGISCAAIAIGLSTVPASALPSNDVLGDGAKDFDFSPGDGAKDFDFFPGGGAKDLLSDNVHNTGAGGMTNCNGSDFCVKKVGDELEVSYEVQFGDLLRTSYRGQEVKGSMIAFPSVLKDVKLDIIATGITGDKQRNSPSLVEFESHPTHKFNTPVNVPIHTPEELKSKGKEFDSGEVSLHIEGKDDNKKDESYKKVYPDNFYVTHLKGENIIKDYKDSGGKDTVVKGMKDGETLSPDSKLYNASLEKAGNMSVDSPYDYLVFNNNQNGVQSFKITGKVKTESDLAYLPIRAKQGFYRCNKEEIKGFGFTNKDVWEEERGNKKIQHTGCENLLEKHEWARSDDTLPEYSLNNDEVTRNNIKNNSEHGLFGSKKCAVTRDMGRYDRIEQDMEPRVLGGENNDQAKSGVNGWGDYYVGDYALHSNPAVTYVSSGTYVAEDGCDQAGVEIALCDDSKDTSSTTPQPTDTKTKENDKDKDKQSTTPEPHTPDAKGDIKTTQNTPHNTQQKTGVHQQQKAVTNTSNKAYKDGFVPLHKSRPVDHSPGVSSSVERGEATRGPLVETGGSAKHHSLAEKIIHIFN